MSHDRATVFLYRVFNLSVQRVLLSAPHYRSRPDAVRTRSPLSLRKTMSHDRATVFLYRVFNLSVQRVLLSAKSLRREAAFVFVDYGKSEAVSWVGAAASPQDDALARELALKIMRKDLNEPDATEEEVPCVHEGKETEEDLEAIVGLLNVTSVTFYGRMVAAEKRRPFENATVCVGLLEAVSWATDVYDFKETEREVVDSAGAAPRATFVPIEMGTVAYVNTGDFWDIWVSRAVSHDEAAKVVKFVKNVVTAALAEAKVGGQGGVTEAILNQHVVMVRQGEETIPFRRALKIFTDFNPPGKCLPKPPSTSKSSKVLPTVIAQD
eukprot:CAMPEP_0173179146 /NCGR_PEP_ID=MMETSP1141-20130122/5948_1 /TAXON_ID=483371 /ORGANISM="non described non described, Strain CCMP2298" /LENGTH=323 /DNA_ID=CAMNT_0014101753 /DNA_START=93 /DNA_END=1061 /DNA_ORIENTATION=+